MRMFDGPPRSCLEKSVRRYLPRTLQLGHAVSKLRVHNQPHHASDFRKGRLFVRRAILVSTFVLAFLSPIASAAQQTSTLQPRAVPQTKQPFLVTAVAISPDGLLVASGAIDGSVYIWNVRSSTLVRVLAGHEHFVGDMAFAPDSRTLFTGSSDLTARLWDVRTGDELQVLKGHSASIHSVALTPDGKTGCTADFDGELRVWDLRTGHNIAVVRTATKNTSVAFSGDCKWAVLAVDKSPELSLWSLAERKLIRTSHIYDQKVNGLSFSPDSVSVLIGYVDGTVQLWNRDTTRVEVLNPATPKQTPEVSNAQTVCFSSDGKLAAASAAYGPIRIWDTASRSLLHTIDPEVIVQRMAFYPGNQYLLHAGMGPMALRKVESGALVRVLSGETQPVGAVAVSTTTLAVCTMLCESVKMWDLRTGQELPVVPMPKDFQVSAMIFSPDDKLLVTGGNDGVIRIWDLGSRKELQTFAGHSKKIRALAMSHNGQLLLSGSEDETVKLWQQGKDKELLTSAGYGGPVGLVAFTPDETQAMTIAWQKIVRFVDLATGKVADEIADDSKGVDFGTIHYGNKGFLLIISKAGNMRDNLVRISDLKGSPEGVVIARNQGIETAALAPDASFAVTGDISGMVRFWDTSTGNEITALMAGSGASWTAVAPDGRFDTNNLERSSALQWVVPDDPLTPLPVEIFARDYYTPKLLPKRLNNEKLSPVRPLGSLNRAQPEVQILEVKPEPASRLVTVQVKVASGASESQLDRSNRPLQSGAYDVRLFRDGQLVATYPEVASTGQTRSDDESELTQWRQQHRILDSGDKVITILHVQVPQKKGRIIFTSYAFNSDRVRSEISQPYTYKPSPSAGSASRHAYLVTMGVNANQSEWDLTLAVASASLVAQLWKNKLAGTYDDVIELRLDSDLAPDGSVSLKRATKSHLEAVLNKLGGRQADSKLLSEVDPGGKLRQATPDDAVILYIASHGYADPQGRFYLIPYDTGTHRGLTEDVLTRCRQGSGGPPPTCDAANEFLARSISVEDLANWWESIDAGEPIMILDSCHSGATPGRGFRPGPLGDRGLGQLSYDKGMLILFATQPEQTARATQLGGLGHTLLSEGLRVSSEEDPKRTVDEWLRATEGELPGKAAQLYPRLSNNDLQRPELMDFTWARSIRTGEGSE